MKYSKQYKDYIRMLVTKAFPYFNHTEFTWSLKFETIQDPAEPFTFAACEPYETTYLEFPIYIYPLLYAEYKLKNYEFVARTITHELSHLLTAPIAKFAIKHVPQDLHEAFTDIEEQQTQRVATALFNAMPDGWWIPTKKEKKVKCKSEPAAS